MRGVRTARCISNVKEDRAVISSGKRSARIALSARRS